MEDVLNAFFSGGGGPSMARGGGGSRRRDMDALVPVRTTLEELYCGATKEITRPRSVLCGTCHGRGTKSNATKTQTRCPICRGAGARIVVQQMGMMMQRMQVACDACGGSGERIDPKDRCLTCNGNKVTQEQTQLTVKILKGMTDREQIIFKGKGDTHPDLLTPGNVVVLLQMERHPTFVRHGDDLHVKHSITLAEALCGFQFKLTHLDGRELLVRRNRGEITRPGEMNMIRGEGMPMKGKSDKNGDLFVHLDITYPESLAPEQLAALQSALPVVRKQPIINEEEDYHTCYATRTSVAEFRAEMEQEEVDEDDDDGDGIHVGGCPMQ